MLRLLVEVGADPLTSLLLMPLSAPSARTRSSTLRVLTLQVGLHQPTANSAWSTCRRRSNRLGKNDPARSLGMRSAQIPGRGRQQPWPVPAYSRASVRMWPGADHAGEAGLDEGLVDRLAVA